MNINLVVGFGLLLFVILILVIALSVLIGVIRENLRK